MIRIVIFLASLGAIAFGFAWVADRPGEVTLTWMGYRIETSIMVAALALALVILIVLAVWSLVRAILRSPEQVSLFFRHRRAVRGYLAISRGLIAIGAGDMALARKSALEAARLSPGDPLALLLDAQSAQLGGDKTGAEQAFRAMLEKPETKLLGLRGLYIEAQRRNDANAARAFAEQAAADAPSLSWAGQAVLDYRCQSGDWAGAQTALDAMKSTLEKSDYRRKRAVLLTARALAMGDSDRDQSLTLVLDAVKLAPDLVPAAALAGRRLAEADNARKARKILETAWVANPHPDIASAYANVRPGDSARERYNRMKKLVEKTPANPEGALALAQAALEARDFKAARSTLIPLLTSPTRRSAALMAEIEQGEYGDEGRAREWMARAMRAAPDPAWTADGVVSEQWLPVSPATGTLDAFQWKVPLAEIGIERPVIDVAEATAPPIVAAAAELEQLDAEAPVRPQSARKTAASAKKAVAEPVIPLVHAPDDPGPDSSLEPDPVPETAQPRSEQWPAPLSGPLSGSWAAPWQKIRQLFR